MSTTVGIDRLHFYCPSFHMNLETLAILRGHKEDFFTRGIGQTRMTIIPPDEDIVTMAANAAYPIAQDHTSIDMLILATESSFDLSKSAGISVHQLLQLSPHCRVFETKQACYGGTAALQMACNHVRIHPEAKVLVIASDVAKYATHTPAEASQGAGALAMLITSNPSIIALDSPSGYIVEDHMDFWRPPYLPHALVNGRLSCDLYLQLLEKSWQAYSKKSGLKYSDHAHFCFHTPVPKLAEKAHKWLARKNSHPLTQNQVIEQSKHCLQYNKLVGNTYTAALYIALLSLLDNHEEDLAHKRIGFYSYGSGCMAEFFSGTVIDGYKNALSTKANKNHLAKSLAISPEQYQNWTAHHAPTEGELFTPKHHTQSHFRMHKIQDHIRSYEKQTQNQPHTQQHEKAIHAS